MNTPNFHVLIVKHIGATNTKAARVKIISERFGQHIYISYTNDAGASNPALDSAILYLSARNYTIVGKAEGKDCYYIISNTFEPIKK